MIAANLAKPVARRFIEEIVAWGEEGKGAAMVAEDLLRQLTGRLKAHLKILSERRFMCKWLAVRRCEGDYEDTMASATWSWTTQPSMSWSSWMTILTAASGLAKQINVGLFVQCI